jgi:hypothetical protein
MVRARWRAAGDDVGAHLGTVWNAWCQGTMDRSQLSRPLSRLLVLLTTSLMLVMPVTEHLCNWDHFLRGGPDVEFSLLAWLLFAAMVVLSMNGSMLQPTMMQPGISAADVFGEGAVGSHAFGISGCLYRSASPFWRAPNLDNSIAASGPYTPVPMRI